MTNCECDAWDIAMSSLKSKVKSRGFCRYVKKSKPHIYLFNGWYVSTILLFAGVNSCIHRQMALDYVRRQNELITLRK